MAFKFNGKTISEWNGVTISEWNGVAMSSEPPATEKPAYPATLNTEHPLASGLIGDWLINEGTGVTLHDTAGSHNATMVSDIEWGTGDLGAEIYTFGVGYMTVGSINWGTNCTMIAWIKPEFTGIVPVFGAVSPVYGELQLRIDANGALHFVQTYVDDIGAGDAGAVTTDTYCMIAGSYSSAGAYVFYVDGEPAGSGTNLKTISEFGMDFGVEYGATYFAGHWVRIMLYNRVLSPTEISALYTSPYGMYQ